MSGGGEQPPDVDPPPPSAEDESSGGAARIKSGRGGPRPGSGRKPNAERAEQREHWSRTKSLQTAVANAAISDGVTPLEFMLRVMRAPIPDDLPVGVKAQLLAIQTQMAIGAAPYCHPKPAPVPAQSQYTPAEHAADLRETLASMNALSSPGEQPA